MSKKRIRSETSNGTSQAKRVPHWSLGLLDAMKDPELQVMTDDKVVVIKDTYPKAKYHYLVLPKENISSLKQVNRNHLKMLEHMDYMGRKVAKHDGDHEKSTFKLGYHAQPSMTRLHLHVISNDMNSECLKTKKHWNSFTSEFFVDSKAVIEDLRKTGSISLPTAEECKRLMSLPLKCHKCDSHLKNIPELKKHILTH